MEERLEDSSGIFQGRQQTAVPIVLEPSVVDAGFPDSAVSGGSVGIVGPPDAGMCSAPSSAPPLSSPPGVTKETWVSFWVCLGRPPPSTWPALAGAMGRLAATEASQGGRGHLPERAERFVPMIWTRSRPFFQRWFVAATSLTPARLHLCWL